MFGTGTRGPRVSTLGWEVLAPTVVTVVSV